MEVKETCSCLLCSGSAELVEQRYPGYQEPLTFDIYYCSNCNTSFSTPRVETSQIYEHIYKNGSKVPAYKRYWQYLNEIKSSKDPLHYLSQKEEMYWAVRHSLLEMNNSKTIKIMEVGCGLGYLTYALVKEGYDVIGIDISKNAVDEAIKSFGNYYICADVFEYVSEHQNLYNVIILTEVIEHLNEPLKFLESIMLMLKKGGRIIITTPNKTVFPKDVSWATELPPIHLWWFTEDSMKFMATKISANVSFIDFSDFYKKKPCLIEVNKFINKFPLLNKDGSVINIPKENGRFRSFLAGIPFFRLLNVKIKSAFSKTYVCQKRGPVMGAIFEKNAM
ncbi:methyltransferase domain-containing protein [Chitinophagaceae bacterium LB-8]|uniref:Methyltransferase domain-containing protein n=1 Tax=Paraflavisolibacter caeni TaxID=2982496 RepID=A0A9X2XWR6_9BACT|nr:class I SAM-dependent methyltransferase [Paraflavisolibacter caeni]MCU7550849.1 methyltransferase domain-containing protein [Paraflavisolibacter caeni]